MRLLLFILMIMIVGCSSEKVEKPDAITKADLILKQSEIGIMNAEVVSQKSDSATRVYVVQQINKISALSKVKTLVKETFIEKLIYKTDTLFIETKKNFWGKSKVSAVKKEGQSEVVDTTTTLIDTTQTVIDTLNQN